MPTLLSHPAIPIAIAVATGRSVSRRLLTAAIVASVLPDVDTVGLYLGVPYAHLVGHRGLAHSLTFAFVVALLGMSFARSLAARPLVAFLVLFASAASHGLLDACTSGGLGIALLSPLDETRYFFPWQPIAVSPLTPSGFTLGRTVRVLGSELRWVWLPAAMLGAVGTLLRVSCSRAESYQKR